VSSFVSLAQQHFFDNTPCHRLTTSGIYVLQCGDPTGTGTGGPGYTIPDELTGRESYPAGTIAMANTGHPNTGGSQFFLVYRNTPLPPQYTVFGHLSPAGLGVVQKVAARGTDNAFGAGDGHPKEKVTITRVTTG
jgi:peptidyl-prolyl cis-trans isomerase B (cyclophilin B)